MTPPYYNLVQNLILLLMLAFFAASIVRPRCAFFGYFIVMTFRPGELYPALGAMRFELVVVIFLLVLMLIHGRGQRLALSFDPLSKSVLIFFGLCIVSIVQAYDISYSYDYAYRVLFPTIIFYVSIVCFADDISDFKMFLYLYIFIVAYLGWLPIFNHFHGIGHERIGAGIIHAKGTTGGVAGHVALANLMVQSMPFAYFMMIQEKGYLKKILLVGALAVYTIAIISSGSRGGFLGMLICGALFVAKSRNKVVSLALIVGGFFAASSLMSDNYLHWMTSILDLGSSDVSASSRWTGLRHGIELAFKRPLLGVGIGCYAEARGAWLGWSIWAHNHYGELIGELGIAGILSWGTFIYLCFKELWQLQTSVESGEHADPFPDALVHACVTALIVRLAIGMFTHSLLIYIWYMIAGMVVVSRHSRYSLNRQDGDDAFTNPQRPLAVRPETEIQETILPR